VSTSKTSIDQPEPHLSPKAAAVIADIQRAQALDQRVIVSRRVAQTMLSIGQTRLLELEKLGLLHSLLDGASRRITTASVYSYLISKAIESHPWDAPPAKARQPSSMRRKASRVRKPSENELRALERANLKRHDDAQRGKTETVTAES
jgi:hypothetical protein